MSQSARARSPIKATDASLRLFSACTHSSLPFERTLHNKPPRRSNVPSLVFRLRTAVCSAIQISPEFISLLCGPRFKVVPIIDIELKSGKGRQGLGDGVIDARGIEEVAIDLIGGGAAPVRVVGFVVAEIRVAVGDVARLGELMFDAVREFGKAFEPVAELCCSPVFVAEILLGSYCLCVI